MGKIQVLPEHLVAKISAGEVIQRPANVVKELVENAIDADASNIRIYIEQAGSTKIKVIDDGTGITKEDLPLAWLPHTTSKLTSLDDLQTLTSMGFRGEALHSISSVSSTTISSRVANQNLGYTLTISNQNTQELQPFGMPMGTEVTIVDLFHNVPARKKFLKSANIELASISKTVAELALAFPQIGFELVHNENRLLDLPKNQTFEDRLEEVLGTSYGETLVPVAYNEPHIEILGFISKPQFATRGKSEQYLFINNRPVIEKVIFSTIRTSYGNLLEARAQPAFALHYKISPELVDVNVHPRKEEVRILNSVFVNGATEQAILVSLQKSNLTYIKQGFVETNKMLLKDKSSIEYEVKNFSQAPPIMQIHKLYLLSQTDSGLLMVDQHAAHERILYEQFLASFEKHLSELNIKQLNPPEIFDVSSHQALLLEDYLPALAEWGFSIETFGKNTFKIIAAPMILADRNLPELLFSMLTDLSSGLTLKYADDKTKQALSYLACRSAIKSGDYLSPTQRQELLENLAQTKTNYTCPHGRPVKVEIKLADLEKMFKRT